MTSTYQAIYDDTRAEFARRIVARAKQRERKRLMAKEIDHIVTVVVLEEDDAARQRLARAVESLNDGLKWTVTAVAGIKAAEDAIRQQMPSVAIIDLQRPDYSPSQVLGWIASLPVSVIVLSDTVDPDLESLGRQAGVCAWLSKDASTTQLKMQLLQSVGEHIQREEKRLLKEIAEY